MDNPLNFKPFCLISRHRSLRGGILIEAVLGLPILFILAFCTIEATRWVYLQDRLNRAAYEGWRYGFELFGLEITTCSSVSGCLNNTRGPRHHEIFQRIDKMLPRLGLSSSQLRSVILTSTLERDASDPTVGRLTVSVETSYDRISGVFGRAFGLNRVQAQYQGPYSYKLTGGP